MKTQAIKTFRNFLLCLFLLATAQQGYSAIYTVNNLTDAGANSLRDCINQANAVAGPHTIRFSVAGTITLASDLPILARVILIDGTTAPGYALWQPTILISGFTVNVNNTASNGSRFLGLGFINPNPHGFVLNGVSNITIEDCNIGTNGGTADMGAAAHGVLMIGCTGVSIRRSILSGSNAHGILIQDSPNTIVSGCHIGCDRLGTTAIGNSAFGILLLNASNNIKIGGITADSMNVISGNAQVAIGIQGTVKTNIRIVGNYIGVNKAGTAAMANQFAINDGANSTNGLYILNNVMSASIAQGVYLFGGSNVKIKGNKFGTDAAGANTIANFENNLDINGTHGTIIGGANAAERNVFGGSGAAGKHAIILQAITNNCVIKGNYIGTNASGTAIAGGGVKGCGIVIKGSNNIVGGTAAGERNIISGVAQTGIIVTDGTANQIVGNYIGVDISKAALGNGYAGILVRKETGIACQDNIITNNVIAWNGSTYPSNPINTTWVQPNKGPGIGIGVTEYSTGNTGTIQNRIRDNEIYCNAGLGISLNRLEPTPGYGNINKNAPVINAASTNTNTFGTALPGDEIQVFGNPTNCGSCQGEVLLGTVIADGAGNWNLATHANYYKYKITAYARDAANNTSEFSVCTDPTLPVQLISFTATHQSEGVALLTWVVAMEINNDYFTVEKSDDGVHFYSIGQRDGAGSSAFQKTYTFVDNHFTNNAYYRLKQTDFDGTSTYSAVRYLGVLATTQLHVYPNPATDNVTISLGVEDKATVSLTLTNALSQVVSSSQWTAESSIFEKQLDLSTLPAGVYILSVSTSTKTTSVKIIKE